jgi:hypothetical protein
MSVRGADGFADIGAYAAIGDSASFALVALDGAIDWLATPSIATAPLCAALLDPDRGGRIELVPDEPFESGRRYLPDTNVLETTFQTANGAVRITDCLNRDETGPLGWCELARRVEGLSGSVPLRWRVYPRFGFGQRDGVAEIRRGLPVIVGDDHLVGCFSWDLGDPTIGRGAA